MKQEFFTNTVQSKFIKSILKSSYLPNIDSCRNGDYIFKGRTYVYGDKIIKCNKSGFLSDSGEIREKLKIYKLDVDDNENGYIYNTKLPIDASKPMYIIGNPEIKSDGGLESIDATISKGGEVALVDVESKDSLIDNVSIDVDVDGDIESTPIYKIIVKEIGKNWFEKKANVTDSFLLDKNIETAGGATITGSDTDYMCTNGYIPVMPNTTYTYSVHFPFDTSVTSRIFQYKNDLTYVGSYCSKVSGTGRHQYITFTTEETCHYIRFRCKKSTNIVGGAQHYYMTAFQIEVGEEHTYPEKYVYREYEVASADIKKDSYTDGKTTLHFPNKFASNHTAGIYIHNDIKNVYLSVVKTGGTRYNYSINSFSYYRKLEKMKNIESKIRTVNPYPCLPDCNFIATLKNKNTVIIKPEDHSCMIGDTNKNRILNISDLNLIRKFLGGGYDVSDDIDTRPYHANFNSDNDINAKDTSGIGRILDADAYDKNIINSDTEVTLVYYTPALSEGTDYYGIKDYEYLKKTVETQNFTSTENYYDNLTHKRLGKFLRYKRDIEDLDLMPFYNCFCGRWLSEYRIDDSFEISKSNTNSFNTKCALVPIKFNRKYKIAVECSSGVRIAPIVMKDDLLQKAFINYQNVDLTEMINKIDGSHLFVNNASFSFPIEYSLNTFLLGEEEENLISKYENYLYILIEINKNVNTSLVVIEGDFNTNFVSYVLDYNSEFNANNNRFFDKICLGNLSLLKFSDGKSYPFADRLIEFLLLNVIDNKDTNSNNILLMQNNSNVYRTLNKNLGMYKDYYRRAIYKKISNSSKYNVDTGEWSPYFILDDITGFVDKDVEKYLTGGGI